MLSDAQPGVFAYGPFGHWHFGAELNCLHPHFYLHLRARCHLHDHRG
jgi:hypothetical protein